MLSIDEALSRILATVPAARTENVAVSESVGCRLAEDVVSDVDSPPYDKSAVDGFAVRSTDVAVGVRELRILEQVAAGDMPRHELVEGTASRIMTGAPLPAGADAVVMVEHTEAGRWNDLPVVRLSERPVRAGQNILRRAQSLAQGQVVLTTGRRVRPIEVGVLSEVGRTRVSVFRRPRVAILATGNELVTASESPRGAQIRNSNGPMLRALAEQSGGVPVELGIARDDPEDLRRHLLRGLHAELLVLSGGVSAGVLDLAPGVLHDLGFEQVFHQVHLRPGKPLWFGVRRAEEGTTLAFGLPGNPVSGLVCWELFVRPALALVQGFEQTEALPRHAQLDAPHDQRGDRPTYWPAVLEANGESPRVRLLRWQGSGDLRTLADANSLAIFPPGDRRYEAGQMIAVREL